MDAPFRATKRNDRTTRREKKGQQEETIFNEGKTGGIRKKNPGIGSFCWQTHCKRIACCLSWQKACEGYPHRSCWELMSCLKRLMTIPTNIKQQALVCVHTQMYLYLYVDHMGSSEPPLFKKSQSLQLYPSNTALIRSGRGP